LARLNIVWITVRSKYPKQDQATQDDFKKWGNFRIGSVLLEMKHSKPPNTCSWMLFCPGKLTKIMILQFFW
jgi:hypothetical protein